MLTGREIDLMFAGSGRVVRWKEGDWLIYDMPGTPMNTNILHHCKEVMQGGLELSEEGYGMSAGVTCAPCTNCKTPVPDHIQALYHLYETIGKGDR